MLKASTGRVWPRPSLGSRGGHRRRRGRRRLASRSGRSPTRDRRDWGPWRRPDDRQLRRREGPRHGAGRATRWLRLLEGSGVAGLGLAVGALRRPVRRRGAAAVAWTTGKGQPFRVYNSPLQAAACHACGGEAGEPGVRRARRRARGRSAARRRAATSPRRVFGGGNGDIGNVTANVVLWPKVFVLAVLAGAAGRPDRASSGRGCARRPRRPAGVGRGDVRRAGRGGDAVRAGA